MKLTEQTLRDIIRKELISLNEGAYKKNDKGSMLTSIIKAKSAQDYGLDNLIVLHKDIKKVFTSKENKQELLSDLNNVIEYMKKAEKFKDTGNENTIAMVEKYWKQLSGQTVDRTQKTITEAVEEVEEVTESIKCTNKKGHSYKEIDKDGTVECEHCGLRNSLSEEVEEVTEAAPKMRKNEEAEYIQDLMNKIASAPKGGGDGRYGKEFDKAKTKALRSIKDMVTYSNIGR